MRLGILGGSFDPVHYGHLLLAEYCREQCQLDKVWFMPASGSPHKLEQNVTSAEQRIEMLGLAVGGFTEFQVSRLEIDRGGVSYTFETLQQIKEQEPAARLFFLMGADSLQDLLTWRHPEKICEFANLVVISRFGSAEPDFAQLRSYMANFSDLELQSHHVRMPRIEISSSDLRRRVSKELSIRFQTPRAVEKYIETQRLYRG